METSGPGAWIHFHTDNSNEDTGFNIQWSAVGDPDNCGGILDDGQGTITSPGYPNENYAGGDTCFWMITGFLVKFHANKFFELPINSGI